MGRGFKDLRVWKLGMSLAKQIYRFIDQLPREEKWNLADQLRRCSVSAPSNIAEGQASGMDGTFLRHIRIARGSLAEMETQLPLIEDLNLCATPVSDSIWDDITNCRKGLINLEKYLKKKRSTGK